MKIAVIGGGAAGFFSAITVKENYPNAMVMLYEKSNRYLAKVKISGGGRCNVTNACTDIEMLCKAYPRGGNSLKKLFYIFNTADTVQWFKTRGVELVAEQDGRMFPVSQTAQTIIDCFLKQVKRLNIHIKLNTAISSINQNGKQLELFFTNLASSHESFDKVIVATGGTPKRSNLEWLEELGHDIKNPVPSLFTFNMPAESIVALMGITIKDVLVGIQGTKFQSQGNVLITHWGMSGPAILKLSSFAARILNGLNYHFNIQVNWTGEKNNQLVSNILQELTSSHAKKKLSNYRPFDLPARFWSFLLTKAGLNEDIRWDMLGKKALNKLVQTLTNDVYSVQGKTTFKEEFVTSGGVALNSIHLKTMQSKSLKNLYFAGEILDIDAITGGYNFQSAWTTGFVAGQLNES